MVFDTINCCDKDAVIADFDVQDVEFIEKEIDISYQASEIVVHGGVLYLILLQLWL